jgi:transcription antitermination factor NusG
MTSLHAIVTNSSEREEEVFLDAISDQVTLISVEEFFDVQDGGDGRDAQADSDDDLSFISVDLDDFSYFQSQEGHGRAVTPSPPPSPLPPPPPLPQPQASATGPAFAAPRRDISNSPRTVTVLSIPHDDFVIGDRVDIIGGKYKGQPGTFVKRTPEKVCVRLDGGCGGGGGNRTATKPVYLVPHNVRRRELAGRVHDTGLDTDTNSSSYVLVSSGMSVSSEDADHNDDDDDSHHSRFMQAVDSPHPRHFKSRVTARSSLPFESPQATALTELESPSINESVDTVVDIIGGTYKDKIGAVVKLTPSRVVVRLFDSPDTDKPVYLAPRNIRYQSSTESRHTATVQARACRHVRSISTTSVQSPEKTYHHVEIESKLPLESPQVTASTESPAVNESVDVVDIIGGTYKDKTGTVVKLTPSRVVVRLSDSLDTDKPVCLAPGNIRYRCSQESRHTVTVKARACRHVRSISTTSMQSPEKTYHHVESKASAWHVPGGKDSTLHSSLGFCEDYRRLVPANGRSEKQSTFAFHLFGHRLVCYKIPANIDPLPSEFSEDRGDKRRYQLLTTKLHVPKSSPCIGFKRADITALYVLVEGGGVPPINLQEELEKVAAFGRLAPGKVAARLELFQSTAQKSNPGKKDYLIFDDLTSADFETIPEIANEGCGYIPREYIQRFLGNCKIGKRTCALQVRIFVSKLGVFKGVLFEKHGIKKIQLPSSMVKVGPSETENVVDKACVLVNGRFPSPNNVHVASLLAGRVPPKSFKPNRISDMMLDVLEVLSVPRVLLDEYAEASHGDRGRGLEHAFCIGVADPTNCIPPGHVFVTGIGDSHISQSELFISRFPCTEAADGRLLPVVRSKPVGMSDSTWEWMSLLHFGVVIFGNPSPGCVPLPQTVANGDLDGDLYFVCWNEAILSSIDTSFDLVENMSIAEDKPSEPQEWNDNWLRDGQDVMRNIKAMVDHHALIGKLYSSIKKADTSTDALWFGRAYKLAIDIGKHGGLVKLPAHLWERLPERFHPYLTT